MMNSTDFSGTVGGISMMDTANVFNTPIMENFLLASSKIA